GYAIDTNSQVYLVTYPDYQFVQLELKDFDYRSMKFHLLADPLHYLVRYDDYETYRAALFDKHYNLLGTTKMSSSQAVTMRSAQTLSPAEHNHNDPQSGLQVMD
ncbi:MAG: DUF4857 domain-containing protein, partial [Thermodesulfobacteriota bacterium]|nr:DUF4857 domain-containing protein [Thermodesulfobacteriota bacterium]